MLTLVEELLMENKRLPTLFHISFRGNLEKEWDPKLPDDIDVIDNKVKGHPEPKDLYRICCAPTIRQCFQAIYPNVNQFFEENKYPYMEFFVYSPLLKGDEQILTPEDLTNQLIVHDAHITHEYCILTKTFMKRIAKIKIMNTNTKGNDLYYYPFNNKNKQELYVPKNVKFSILETYDKSIKII